MMLFIGSGITCEKMLRAPVVYFDGQPDPSKPNVEPAVIAM